MAKTRKAARKAKPARKAAKKASRKSVKRAAAKSPKRKAARRKTVRKATKPEGIGTRIEHAVAAVLDTLTDAERLHAQTTRKIGFQELE